jgi:predicted ATPase with chaperone activity
MNIQKALSKALGQPATLSGRSAMTDDEQRVESNDGRAVDEQSTCEGGKGEESGADQVGMSSEGHTDEAEGSESESEELIDIDIEVVEEGGKPPAPPAGVSGPPPDEVDGVDETKFLPLPPRSVEATGLSISYLEELCLRHLYTAGTLRGADLFKRICLSQIIVEELIDRLRKSRFVEVQGARGAGIGYAPSLLALTRAGHEAAARATTRDGYVGPAPVVLSHYIQAISTQTVRNNTLGRESIESHFRDLVIRETIFDSLGPALNSGRSLFVYGPPGNGKSAICERLASCLGGAVFIPHAVMIDDFVIRIFDPSIHKPVEHHGDRPILDNRWVYCRRPMVMAGGELSMAELDLIYWPELRYYEAPLQLKANCGVLLIDDFGRQRLSPKQLLNRWIVPLEADYDFLTLHTGKKVRLPFDVFVIFSTNLEPHSLVDHAFLRRVRYKLEMSRPDVEQFRRIFEKECFRASVPFRQEALDRLIAKHYKEAGRPFNACEPRDLIAQVKDLSRYHRTDVRLTDELIDQAVANYFVDHLEGRS